MGLKMRWSKNKSRRSDVFDILIAIDIIYEGYLKWHIYQMALSKIRANLNGSWMFEQRDNNYTLNLSILNKNE